MYISNKGVASLYTSTTDDDQNWVKKSDIITNADIQSGVITVNASANGITEFSVTFPKAFSSDSSVTTSILTSRPDLRTASPISRTRNGFTGAVYNGSTAANVSVSWIAKQSFY